MLKGEYLKIIQTCTLFHSLNNIDKSLKPPFFNK